LARDKDDGNLFYDIYDLVWYINRRIQKAIPRRYIKKI
jgi:hypothetical protein